MRENAHPEILTLPRVQQASPTGLNWTPWFSTCWVYRSEAPGGLPGRDAVGKGTPGKGGESALSGNK